MHDIHATPSSRFDRLLGGPRGRLGRTAWGLGLTLLLLLSAACSNKEGGAGHGALKRADFSADAHPSRDARFVADWVVDSADNQQLPFAILDKVNAQVFVFDRNGRQRGVAPVLLGGAKGDDSVPGIGERKMADIQPHERTTPAGRFVAEPGRNMQGEDIIWVDYGAAVSMHRVRANNPAERRLERLASPAADDNRISYGCINIPAEFFDKVVSPAFHPRGVVYVLPEQRSLGEVFRSAYDPQARARQGAPLALRGG